MCRIKYTSETIYDNCQVYSLEGTLISYTSKKKALKLIKWNSAELISEEPFIIKIKKDYKKPLPDNILVPRENNCVCCGVSENLTRHHVIPHEYSKFMGIKFKRYNYGNVLALCFKCHQNYEMEANKLKEELSIKYNAPFIDRKANQIFSLSATILNSEKIPYDRILKLYKELASITNLNISDLTEEFLNKLMEENHRSCIKTHSRLIWESIKDNQEEFISMWKAHFLEWAKPKHLPEFWHYYLNKFDKKSI